MSADLKAAAGEYLEQRRARGYKLRDQGVLLMGFVEALHARGVEQVTIADALAFAQRGPQVIHATQAAGLGVIRAFAAWLRAADPAAAEEIPPGLIRGSHQRIQPYLYTPTQVGQLMAAAHQLPDPFLAEAMQLLIGLLYVTGLRSGEAFGLEVEDFDQARLVLEVRGKLGRQRLVPVHPSTAEKLTDYIGRVKRRTGFRGLRTGAHRANRELLPGQPVASGPVCPPAAQETRAAWRVGDQ